MIAGHSTSGRTSTCMLVTSTWTLSMRHHITSSSVVWRSLARLITPCGLLTLICWSRRPSLVCHARRRAWERPWSVSPPTSGHWTHAHNYHESFTATPSRKLSPSKTYSRGERLSRGGGGGGEGEEVKRAVNGQGYIILFEIWNPKRNYSLDCVCW